MQYNLEFNKWDFMLIGAGLAVAAVAGIYFYHGSGLQHDEFAAQCAGEGRKQYECEAMWRGSAVFVPIVVKREEE